VSQRVSESETLREGGREREKESLTSPRTNLKREERGREGDACTQVWVPVCLCESERMHVEKYERDPERKSDRAFSRHMEPRRLGRRCMTLILLSSRAIHRFCAETAHTCACS